MELVVRLVDGSVCVSNAPSILDPHVASRAVVESGYVLFIIHFASGRSQDSSKLVLLERNKLACDSPHYGDCYSVECAGKLRVYNAFDM